MDDLVRIGAKLLDPGRFYEFDALECDCVNLEEGTLKRFRKTFSNGTYLHDTDCMPLRRVFRGAAVEDDMECIFYLPMSTEVSPLR